MKHIFKVTRLYNDVTISAYQISFKRNRLSSGTIFRVNRLYNDDIISACQIVSNDRDYQEVLTVQLSPADPLFKGGRLFYQNSQLLKGALGQI